MARVYTYDEVAAHNNRDDCWIIINGGVYDLTPFIDDHPGGGDVLLNVAGQDGSQGFEETGHSEDARERMEEYLIGVIDPGNFPRRGNFTPPVYHAPPRVNTTPTIQISQLLLILLLAAALGYFWQILLVLVLALAGRLYTIEN